MSVRHLVIGALGLPGCVGAISTGIMASVGPAKPPTASAAVVGGGSSEPSGPGTDGVELHWFAAGKLTGIMPNALGYSIRQTGNEHTFQETQVGWAGALPIPGNFVFGRLMFDLIALQGRDDGDHNLSAFSPTLELGIAPAALKYWCISGEVTHEIHLDGPDRTLVGAFLGFCGHENH